MLNASNVSNMSIQENLNNQNLQRQREIVPIYFDEIIATPTVFKTIRLMREYAKRVLDRLNIHFGLIMTGENIGKIQVLHKRRETNDTVLNVITVNKAKEIYTRHIDIRWIGTDGTVSRMKKNIIDFWMKSPKYRREIYPSPVQTELRQSPIVSWLATHINDPFALSPVRFGQLNDRNMVYDTFRNEVNATEEWTAKRISECFYHYLPQSRPRKGYRCRIRGVSMIYIPKKAYCERILVNLQSHDINLMF